MKTHNVIWSKWMRRVSSLMAVLMLFLSFAGQASARILFQDDDYHDINSEGIILNADDGGDEDVTLQFGNDATDATITFDDGTGDITFATTGGDFSFSDDNLAGTGGLDFDGVINFSNASNFYVRQAGSEPANCTEGEIYYNTANNTTYVCTDTDTWTALSSGSQDFESVYGADGDKSLSVTDNLATGFEIKEGANSYFKIVTTDASEAVQINEDAVIGDGGDTVVINSSDWDINATGDMTGIGAITADGLITGTLGATLSGATISLNNDSNFAVNIATGTSSGAVTIGGNNNTVAVNSSDWDINATGDMTGIGAITADGLITGTLGATISGAATSINNNSDFATNINTGTSSGAVSIGGGSGTVAVNSSSWDISTAGAASGFTTIDASGNITTSGGDFIVGTTGLSETTGPTDSGAYLVGVNDEFDNSASTTVQDVLDDLDALIGSNAPNVDSMTFEAEYPNAVIYQDGTNNNGKLEALYDNTNREHYYRWTTTKNASHDVDIRFRYELPADYSSAGNMTVRLRTDTTTAGDNSISIIVRNDTDNATCHDDGSTTGAVANTWETVTITGGEIETGCTGGSALDPGDIIEVQLKFAANDTSSGGTDVGTLSFAYTN